MLYDEPAAGQAYMFLNTDQVCFRRLIDDGDWWRDGGQHLAFGPYVRLTEVDAVVLRLSEWLT